MSYSTHSISETRVSLREDLVFRPQRYQEESCYVIEDPATTSFHRIGIAEYTFISLLDGTRSIRDAMHHASSSLGRDALNEQEAATICRWLVDSGLAKTHTSDEAQRLHKKNQARQAQQNKQWKNPIVAKIPLFQPERFLDHVAPWCMWTTRWPMFALWMMGVCVAMHQLVTHGSRLRLEANQVLIPHNWLSLGLTWLLLKVVHEFYHALFCRKFGGEVREAGAVVIACAPIFYVDVTSSWRFASKWQRMLVAAAGMLAEVFIGAIAALVWVHGPEGTVQQVALNVMLLSTVTTLLFNANPLMRFDGYYILSDLLEIPNLAPQGQQYLSYWGRRYLYGVDAQSPLTRRGQDLFVRCYGVAAMVWRFLITISIGLVVATLFEGVGMVIVAVAGVLWVARPLIQNLHYFVLGGNVDKPNRLYTTKLAMGMTVVLVALGVLAPWPFAIKAPGVIDYRAGGQVRTEVAGFVREVHVQPGQLVEQGQLLVELENAQLTAEAKRIASEVNASQKRIDMAAYQGNIAALRIEQENLKNFRSQWSERKKQIASFQILAPSAGKIVADDLDSLTGTYLEIGYELLQIGDESQKQIRLSIAQSDALLFAGSVGKQATVKLRGGKRERLTLPIMIVEPGASTAIEYPAVTAAGGGSLAVRPKAAAHTAAGQDWEFVEPRLAGLIRLPEEEANRLRAGQLAMVRLPMARSQLGRGVYQFAERWIRQKWRSIQKT